MLTKNAYDICIIKNPLTFCLENHIGDSFGHYWAHSFGPCWAHSLGPCWSHLGPGPIQGDSFGPLLLASDYSPVTCPHFWTRNKIMTSMRLQLLDRFSTNLQDNMIVYGGLLIRRPIFKNIPSTTSWDSLCTKFPTISERYGAVPEW